MFFSYLRHRAHKTVLDACLVQVEDRARKRADVHVTNNNIIGW